MIDHMGITVASYPKAKAFYEKVLATIGYTLIMEPIPNVGGFGKNGKPTFWVGEGTPDYWGADNRPGGAPLHVAFLAPDRASIKAFYEAAIAAGAKDHGAPGLRPIYHQHYYGAFVLDLDGNNIEAVVHMPE